MSGGRKRSAEFDLIAKIFAPLAHNEAGALGLSDDAAFLKPSAEHDIVVTTDAIVAGVHFLPSDPPETIAQKALHVNLSDLAAKGATPRAYLLTAMLAPEIDDSWLKAFAAGLKRSQKRYTLSLIGGDTVATPGPTAFNIVALGEVPRGRMLTRGGARIGDDVWVSGTIGDAALGLRVLQGKAAALAEPHRNALVQRYRVPLPRLGVGRGLVGLADAALDVSDGLIADLGHIADVSRVAIRIDIANVPLSKAAGAALAVGVVSLHDLVTGGDDYELAFTAPRSATKALNALAARAKVRLTRIGQVLKGKGVRAFDGAGKPLAFERPGYTHF
ncbi:MAG: thiamine-phosphate kinase [Alphaproteobacteria bacterium]|nr:thiamine-phosphate kinase [Alphaproteobacteria bacterium]